jgi:hypothetical protein
MSHYEARSNFVSNASRPIVRPKPPFKVDLCCNINIEVHVAMRLGELIKASRTEDKQLIALGCQLSSAMEHLVTQLDDRQWDKLSSYMDEQEQEDVPESDYSDNYVHKARNSFPQNVDNFSQEYKSESCSCAKTPLEMKELVSSIMSKKI